ncbi:hypothetical protein QM716_04535 [Rhodococcus sp. IEGM 1409]|uniref:hypothetical protein n=1 Tax=Rhodococcus sp. IEGM 1409 TaxID=3047082 RepID=UPI0024B71562|nr:hypothetical protein [Rhodococcus sp. IEGM 1409]MDI9899115.1 hypothetical protein [Rhodococcus sp. IEGM 1409]
MRITESGTNTGGHNEGEATGMVGNSVLRECLDDPRIDTVVTVGRNSSGATTPKIVHIVHRDLLDYRLHPRHTCRRHNAVALEPADDVRLRVR